MIPQPPMELWYTVGASALGIGGYAFLKRRRATQRIGYGSSTWASLTDVREAGLLQGPGIVFGKMRRHYLRSGLDSHVLLVGPTRSGKDVSTIIPTLLTWPYSVIVLDIKGEDYDITGAYRAAPRPYGLGQQVYRFNLMGTSGHRYNLLDMVRWETNREVDDCERLAYGLSAPTARPDAKSEFWRGHGYDLLKAILLYLGYQNRYPRSIAGTYAYMTDRATTLVQKVKPLRESDDGIVAGEGHRLSMLTPQRQSEIWDSAIRLISLWSNPLVAHHTSHSDFRIEDIQLGACPVSLYLQVTAEDLQGRYCPLFRLMLDQIIWRLIDRPVDAFTHPVLLLLNEAGQLRHMASIETVVSLAAGYGLAVCLVFQSPNQLERWYGENNSITDNCKIRVFYGPNDERSAALYEKYLGPTTVREEVQTASGTAETWHTRPLQYASEILEWGPEDAYVRITGCKPVKCHQARYYQDRWFRRKLAALTHTARGDGDNSEESSKSLEVSWNSRVS